MFFYLDPYGIKDVDFETVKQIYERDTTQSTEILLNFNFKTFMRMSGNWSYTDSASVPELPLHAGQRLANRYSFTVEHGARALSWYRYRTILRQATHSKVSSGSRPAW